MAYNATVVEYRLGKKWGVFVAEVNSEGKMIRSNSVQCTGLEGTVLYDDYLRKTHPESTFVIHNDNCQGYWDAFSGGRRSRK